MQRLYGLLGIKAVYPKPNTSKPNKVHGSYPYLLKGLNIDRANQVWCDDFTYLRLKRGFVYLVAIMDWFSRYVLGWELSPSLEADFGIELLEVVLQTQCCQLTSHGFTQLLLNHDIRISIDGKGRAFDNIFIERLWRSVTYECIYLQEFETSTQVKDALANYFQYYNQQRLQPSLSRCSIKPLSVSLSVLGCWLAF